MKKFSLSAAVVLMMAAMAMLAGCGEKKDTEWENKKKAAIEKFLGEAKHLSYKNLVVDSAKKSLIIEDLKGSFKCPFEVDGKKESYTINYTIARLEATGVNFADALKGVVPLAENVVLSNVKYVMDMPPALAATGEAAPVSSFQSDYTVEQVVMTDIKVDYDTFIKSVLTEETSLQAMNQLKFHSGAINYKNATSLVGTELIAFELGVESFSAKNMTFEQCDDVQVTNYTFTDHKTKVKKAVIKSVQAKKINFVGMLDNFAKVLDLPEDPSALFAGDMLFEGAVANDISVFTDNGQIDVKTVALDFSKKGKAVIVKSSLTEMTLPASLLDSQNMLPVGKFSDVYKQPLIISSNIDIAGSTEDKLAITINDLSFSDKNLGGVVTSVLIRGDSFDLNPATGDFDSKNLVLVKGKSVFTDTGIVDLGYAFAMAAQGVPVEQAIEQGKLMRNQFGTLAATQCVSLAGAEFKNLCDSFSQIAAAAGVFEISLEPKEPLPLDQGVAIQGQTIDSLGLKWNYTAR